MPPKPFYEIEQKTYLFGKATLTELVAPKRRKMPEEKVRQWVLFELLSTYGYNINDIKIEVPAKMGRGYHPADIVVYKDHQPYIVIECKKIGSNEKEEAIRQVITYANGLKTQFAVYVDGRDWLVKRLIIGEWFDIHDIPPKFHLVSDKNLVVMLEFIAGVRPLLYWSHRTVPTDKVPKYFSYLEPFVFFVGFNYLREINSNLHLGVDSIVKIIFQPLNENGKTSFMVDDYKKKNFLIALSFFKKYLEELGSNSYLIDTLDVENRTFDNAIECLYVELNSTLSLYSNIVSRETLFFRFAVALLRYLLEVVKEAAYLPLEFSVTKDLYSLINLILISEFDSELPDSLDADNANDLVAHSSEYWIEKA
ncbi:MAG: type I restriction enzyme HsdR N-terminal domain-containing protein [Anaerolineae bacterium]|nr:type I restriction enzyme HsdR N-terminal domain-containing protein [Anaerolineae bacterium]